MTVEERRLKRILEHRDLPTHRRLTQIQGIAGARKTAQVRDFMKDS